MSLLENVLIIPYEPDYDNLLIQFEQDSALPAGPYFPESHIKISTKFFHKYASKSLTYESSTIWIAVDKNTQEILGTCHMLTKSVIFSDKEKKIILITGLKVHTDLQGQGIATKILAHIEKKTRKQDINSIYLQLSMNNLKIYKLFKTKYSFSDVSFVIGSIIRSPLRNDSISEMKPEDSLKLTNEFYKYKDMGLVDFSQIFKSPAYVGTFIHTKGSEYIGGSLWNASYYSEVELSKVILSRKHLESNIGYAVAWASLLLLALGYYLACYLLYFWIEEKYLQITFFAVAAYIALMLLQWCLKIYTYLKDFRKVDKPRMRIFGLFYTNSIESKQDMLNVLLRHLAAVTENKYTAFEYNEDDLYSKFIKEKDYEKVYLQKNINRSQVFKWNKRHFVDPRE